MENINLYIHKPDFEGILEKVKTNLPKAEVIVIDTEEGKTIKVENKSGWFSPKKILKINYRERLNPSYHLRNVNCPVSRQMAGMYGYIQGLPLDDEKVRALMLRKIETINAQFAFIMETFDADAFTPLLADIAKTYNAFLFVPANSSLNKSASQKFLDSSFNLLFDTNGNSGSGIIKVEIESKYFDEQSEVTPDQEEQKAVSEAFLQSKGIAINRHLPYTPSVNEVELRTKPEIIERAYALLLFAAKGEGVPLEQLDSIKTKFEINGFSPQEEHIYKSTELTEGERARATWRYESLALLMWALGFPAELKYPSAVCDVEYLINTLIKQSRAAFEAAAVVKSKEEILNELDKTYRMSWACVEARLKGKTVGGELHPGIVNERHYALNWLTCYNNEDWDDVSTDT